KVKQSSFYHGFVAIQLIKVVGYLGLDLVKEKGKKKNEEWAHHVHCPKIGKRGHFSMRSASCGWFYFPT
ncbi:MAG: hypothetical protein KDB98_11945, partial [Flavobacteriales bacterium]|nr:hypothetical protein [Flavobacteriales bacterium]